MKTKTQTIIENTDTPAEATLSALQDMDVDNELLPAAILGEIIKGNIPHVYYRPPGTVYESIYCPFCGCAQGTVHRERDFIEGSYRNICEGCKATGPIGKTPNIAVAAFDRRVEGGAK